MTLPRTAVVSTAHTASKMLAVQLTTSKMLAVQLGWSKLPVPVLDGDLHDE